MNTSNDLWLPSCARLSVRSKDEQGFTLIEMMVAILILGIILTAMASVIITSLTAMQRDEQRVRATQLAQEELEHLRAIDWDCAGFAPAGAPYADYNGNTTVVYDAADCADPASAPSATAVTRTVDGIAYTVLAHVYWIDDPVDGTGAAGTDSDPEDYKEFTVDVSWMLRGQAYTHSDSSTRVPTVQEKPLDPVAVASFQIASMSVNPTTITTSGGATTSAIVVEVETSAAASAVSLSVASPSTYGSANLSDISSGARTRWRLTIPSGSTQFPIGTYNFTANATGAGGGSDAEAVAVTVAAAPGTTPVLINTPLLTPGPRICVDSNRKPHQNVVVTVDVDGVSTSDQVTIAWTDTSGSATVTAVGSTTGGAKFTGSIPTSHRFNSATTTLTVGAKRVSDNTVAQAAYSVTIVERATQAGCP